MKPIASLSLDLDDKWSYFKIHGDERWKEFPSYLGLVVPRLLEILAEEDLKITFFIVGQDAALEHNRPILRSIVEAGHEIGNHSFHHESWLHRYDIAHIRDELRRAHDAIEAASGVKPEGFRGPGFSLSENVLVALKELGYRYDCSTWPTFIGPLARAYYLRTKDFSEEERAQRDLLFGAFSEGFRPLRAYTWGEPAAGLAEIPVSTLPVLRVPVHVSYLLYLSMVSPKLAEFYSACAFKMFRLFRTPPSVLLHSLDFLGKEDEKDLAFFPGMNLPAAHKIGLARKVLKQFKANYRVLPMGAYVDAAVSSKTPVVTPVFPSHRIRIDPNAAVPEAR